MPLKIDCYQGCGGRCLYCSVNGLRGKGGGNAVASGVTPNSAKFIERYFYHSGHSQEHQLIEQRSPVQLGVLSDPLQPAEKQHHITLKVLKILQDREYPCVITTKYPDRLCEDQYLKVLRDLPCVVQCSTSGNERLESGCPSIRERMEALQLLHNAGVIVQLRLWPYSREISGPVDGLLGMSHEVGCTDVLCNWLKVYHSGGCGQRLKEALGCNIDSDYVNYGLYKAPPWQTQIQDFQHLQTLCRTLGMSLYSCNFPEERQWQDCCGVSQYKGFEGIAKWGFMVNGYRIQQRTTFEEYIKGHSCPFEAEFHQEWNKGKLALISGILFNQNDLTYTRRVT